jgi:outer membrane biosynthesis protein TonB
MVDTNTVAIDTDSLADFELLLQGKANVAPPVEETPEPAPDPVEEDESEDNPLAPEDASEEEDEEIEIPVDEQEESKNLRLKPKKKSAQERIDEVTAARRAAEREVEELRRQLAERSQPKEEPKPQTQVQAVSAGPTPDDVNEAGEAVYPLGEFDQNFIRDLTRFTLQQERDAQKAQDAAESRAAQERAAVEEIQEGWQARLAAVQESLPDIQEKGMRLEPAFDGLDPDYSKYIAQTIMSLDHGPEVLYYLSDHLEEARALVAGGPLKATLGLGELNSMFKTKKEAPVKVTSAPEPPVDRVRGSGGRVEVPDDTDDLPAFEKKFYKR